MHVPAVSVRPCPQHPRKQHPPEQHPPDRKPTDSIDSQAAKSSQGSRRSIASNVHSRICLSVRTWTHTCARTHGTTNYGTHIVRSEERESERDGSSVESVWEAGRKRLSMSRWTCYEEIRKTHSRQMQCNAVQWHRQTHQHQHQQEDQKRHQHKSSCVA
mmetsp:Transcript_52083/g.130847  ORF Transcript_52083/g.130847 Transcript_52083/m.130847 type:complete len:159 (-) Transcript_52083:1514-1990(-)